MFYERFIQLCELNNEKPTIVLKEINISPSNVQKWRDGATVNSNILVKLSEHFGVSVDYLLGRETPNKTVRIDTANKSTFGNNSPVNDYTKEPDGISKELLNEFEKLEFGDKAKVMSLIAELSEKRGA